MTYIGYTAGGSPIFYGNSPKLKGKKNPRFKCKRCGHRTTKNQLKLNGHTCHQCKAKL